MKKGSRIALIILAVLTLVCVIGFGSCFANANKRLDEIKSQAQSEGEKTIILLAGDWDYAAIELITAPKLGNKEEVVQRMDLWKEKLGTLITSEGKITNSRFDIEGSDGAVIYSEYTAECEFEKGNATVVLELSVAPGNKWLLENFTVTPAE